MKVAITAMVSAIWIPATSSAAVTIDSFRAGEMNLTSAGSVVQEGLDTKNVLGGIRTITVGASRSLPFEARVNTSTGEFSFHSETWGYFSLEYTFAADSGIDLLGDGSTAFRLDFPNVGDGQWRGSYNLSVDGISYSFARDLFDLKGPGAVEVPFSHFTSGPTFTPSNFVVSASRVEPGARIALASITTIPEPGTASLLALTMVLLANRRRAGESRR